MASLLELGRTPCSALRREHVGTQVVLFGWVHRRRDHGGRIFVDLRDREGITQVAFGPDIDAAAHEAADALRSEFCIGVAGKVIDRGENENPSMATGAIEVEASRLEVFSVADTPPFSIADDDRLDADENLRLAYRYLDLRRPSLQKNLVTRAKITHITRRTLADEGFYELETPTMVEDTPGGARSFVVPSRLHAMAESPQIYTQLFMVAGFEKSFQITRCHHDEDLRDDRQPELTQIDVELSFATPERLFEPIERLMRNLWKDVLDVELPSPFLRLTWDEAMARFGSASPDMRFGLELRDATAASRGCGFEVFEAAQSVMGLVVPADKAAGVGQSQLDELTAFVEERENGGAKGLAWVRIEDDGSWDAPFAKDVRKRAQAEITAAMGGEPGSLMLFVADAWHTAHTVLGSLRLHLRDRLELLKEQSEPWRFLWVTDLPLFEKHEKGWVSSRHPFTSPRAEHLDILTRDPGKVRAQAYALVLNGTEIGGGSIRIHRSDVQAKVFSALGISEADAQRRFGFLLEAFRYGPPPHGGIALGLDRISMLMCGADSLRDVIAFPKAQRGRDLMTRPALHIHHRPLPDTEGA